MRQPTRRQIELLELASRGLSYAEIGCRLNLREGTVKNHMTNLHRRLESDSLCHALRIAIEQRWIEVP